MIDMACSVRVCVWGVSILRGAASPPGPARARTGAYLHAQDSGIEQKQHLLVAQQVDDGDDVGVVTRVRGPRAAAASPRAAAVAVAVAPVVGMLALPLLSVVAQVHLAVLRLLQRLQRRAEAGSRTQRPRGPGAELLAFKHASPHPCRVI